jgi:hypothetical protein
MNTLVWPMELFVSDVTLCNCKIVICLYGGRKIVIDTVLDSGVSAYIRTELRQCYCILQFGPCIFLWWIKYQQIHHSFNVLVLNILLHVSAFQNAIIRESDMNMLRWCPMSWKSRGLELYIVTDGVMVGT